MLVVGVGVGETGCIESVMLLFITDVGWGEERPAVWHPDIIRSVQRNDINKVSFAAMGPGGLIKHLQSPRLPPPAPILSTHACFQASLTS